jgi:hypothetical protein
MAEAFGEAVHDPSGRCGCPADLQILTESAHDRVTNISNLIAVAAI